LSLRGKIFGVCLFLVFGFGVRRFSAAFVLVFGSFLSNLSKSAALHNPKTKKTKAAEKRKSAALQIQKPKTKRRKR
jgi:hypothetical protein